MLLPSTDAARFLAAYKELLQATAGQAITGIKQYTETRNAIFETKRLGRDLPTAHAELLAALETASFGQFIVCRHMARVTEMIGPDDAVYRVCGVTSELRDLVEPWQIVRSAVMQFAGFWICDGLIELHNIRIGPNMKKDLLAKIRRA